MKMHELSPAPGEKTTSKRLGRGIGSGLGKTSGKGHKGQNARSGGGVRPGFEGGQMPLVRRIPKRGFNNIFRKEYFAINIQQLDMFDNGTVVDMALLEEKGLVKGIGKFAGVKILGAGELTKKLTVKAHKFSKTAQEAIEKAGGTVEVL